MEVRRLQKEEAKRKKAEEKVDFVVADNLELIEIAEVYDR